VERAKELIAAGDFMQVQVGQRIKKRYTESPLSLYRALRSLNPSPYMYYYHFGDFHVVGASPEILVRQEHTPEGRRSPSARWPAPARAAPRPRRTRHRAVELVNDPKERAEHVMLIDLARNDIGRIAKIGSVKVTEAFAVERYSHVMHIVSNVEGLLNDGMTNMDVLKATFPAGTLTGAPKVHAMELIDQLEPVKRGSTAAPAATSATPATWTWRSPSAPASSRTRCCTCRPPPAWWPIRCPRWSGGKPNTRRGRCCARRAGRGGAGMNAMQTL
jgi:anthranilate synthase component I